ncbi:hypothetical protein GF319_07260 [Candidatus Bathyarchaeota archaeon]|jgi:hypothetical protein|nr:hypothetical protein [Candidatus Bathyarchaeota archaeon]
MESKILYFERPGAGNTDTLMRFASKRAKELGITYIVVATTQGGTALKAREIFSDDIEIVAVTIAEGFSSKPGWCIKDENREKLLKKNIKVLTSSHALGDGVGSAFSEKYGGKPLEEVVRDTLYLFCQGMKVCVEIVLMAADSGIIPMNEEIMSIGGSGEGADTCIVVKPAYPRTFLDLEIREILSKPREI